MDAGPIKKVPKWAWIASVGVVGGVAVMRWRSNQGSQADTASAGDATAPGDYSQGIESFPATGTVTSPGYSGGGDGGSSVDLPSLIDSLGNIFAQAQPDWPSILASLPGYAGGGGAPISTNTGAAPATNDAAPVAPAPQAGATPQAPPPAAVKTPVNYGPFPYTEQRTRDNGKSGSARKVWCNCVRINRYTDSRPSVVVGETKLYDGACKSPGHTC